MSETAAFSLRRLYDAGLADGLKGRVKQWDSVATLAQYRRVYALAESLLRPGMRVLDWGCGNGHFSYYLTRRGDLEVDAFSFDETPEFLKDAKGFRHHRGGPDDPVSLPYPDDTFDLVFSIGVLEHVYETGGDEVASLQQIRRVLKPGGGFVCVHFPNKGGWIEPVGRKLGVAPHFHHRKYDLADIRRLTQAADFKLGETARYNFFPRNQLWRLPGAIVNSDAGVAAVNGVDDLFNAVFHAFSQNYLFVARRPA